MKILLIGNGGREHAIGNSIVNSPSFQNSELIFTSPNAGLEKIATPVDIKPDDVSELLKFAVENKIDFTIVGTEVPLSLGLADEFRANGLKVFGPGKRAARIESSKIFAKELMFDAGIPTAKYRAFSDVDVEDSFEYIKTLQYPIVIKADGLAAGKGVVIADTETDAVNFIDDLVKNKIHGDAGLSFIIEEFLTGQELSVFVITDGSNFKILPPAQDHKRIGDGDTGPNTGGMGAYAPASKFLNDELIKKIEDRIITKTLNALSQKDSEFKGCLYCGLIVDENNNPSVIEFNCRFGDPETQAVLQLIESDFLQLLFSSEDGNISDYDLRIKDGYACTVVAASGGYPADYEKGKVIAGLDEINDCNVFHCGTKIDQGHIVSNGGRVLAVTSYDDTSLENALKKAYDCIEKIYFEKIYYRKDIGKKGI